MAAPHDHMLYTPYLRNATLAGWKACSTMRKAEAERQILARQAVSVMLTPEDLADTFLFLASDGAAAFTGQCLCPSHGEVML